MCLVCWCFVFCGIFLYHFGIKIVLAITSAKHFILWGPLLIATHLFVGILWVQRFLTWKIFWYFLALLTFFEYLTFILSIIQSFFFDVSLKIIDDLISWKLFVIVYSIFLDFILISSRFKTLYFLSVSKMIIFVIYYDFFEFLF